MGNARNSRESNFQAMVMPPISESLNRRRKVPSGSLRRRLVTYCLLMKPMINLARMKERMWVGV